MRGSDFGVIRAATKRQSSKGGWNTLELQNSGFIAIDEVDTDPSSLTGKKAVMYTPWKMDFKSPSEHWIKTGDSKKPT